MIDLGMAKYSLNEAKTNLASAARWLRATIEKAEEVGATSLACDLRVIKAYLESIHPVDEPLALLDATMAKHKDVLESADRHARAKKILAVITGLPEADEENVVGVLTELDKRKVF